MKQQLRKNQFKSLLLAVLAFVPFTASAQVEINETNFPDANFRSYLLERWYGQDGVISESEIGEITQIAVDSLNISSLKGIEHFTALKSLLCNHNQLTSLDVSQNPSLTSLACDNNQLSTLDVSHNTNLTGLYCNNNQLTTLNAANCAALTSISCVGNQLTTLNISNCIALTTLYCGGNQLTTLDISNCTALINLSCGSNQLTALDISGCTALIYLQCCFNQLETLDVSNCAALEDLWCRGDLLTTLDLSKNSALKALYCGFNQLTTLDVSNNPALSYLFCSQNMIKGTSMDVLIEGLPQNTSSEEYFIDIYDDLTDWYGTTEGNVCTKDQVEAAKAKGWVPEYFNGIDWVPYEGSEPTGIVLPTMENIDENTLIYDLSGKRMNNLHGKKGIYIIGGKKVLKK